jgi:hypothetical protein
MGLASPERSLSNFQNCFSLPNSYGFSSSSFSSISDHGRGFPRASPWYSCFLRGICSRHSRVNSVGRCGRNSTDEQRAAIFTLVLFT